MKETPRTFHSMLIQSRLEADQTTDAMGILLNLGTEEYESIEAGKYPADETLVRLCKMMEWNYYEAQRLIINEMISPHPKKEKKVESESVPPIDSSFQFQSLAQNLPASEFKKDTLGTRLIEARESVGQSVEIISMMLKTDVETYRGLEAGGDPSDDLLRRISVIYNWNYNELKDLLLSERAVSYQPHIKTPPTFVGGVLVAQFQTVIDEMTRMFGGLSQDDQKTAMVQVELIRDTMRRHQKVSA